MKGASRPSATGPFRLHVLINPKGRASLELGRDRQALRRRDLGGVDRRRVGVGGQLGQDALPDGEGCRVRDDAQLDFLHELQVLQLGQEGDDLKQIAHSVLLGCGRSRVKFNGRPESNRL